VLHVALTLNGLLGSWLVSSRKLSTGHLTALPLPNGVMASNPLSPDKSTLGDYGGSILLAIVWTAARTSLHSRHNRQVTCFRRTPRRPKRPIWVRLVFGDKSRLIL
jgi:hypothetical protein